MSELSVKHLLGIKYINKDDIKTETNSLSEILWTNIYRKETGKIELIKNKA